MSALKHVQDAITSSVAFLDRLKEAIGEVARVLADLKPGESWPTNAELFGALAGTRGDEYRAEVEEKAREVLWCLVDLGWVPTIESVGCNICGRAIPDAEPHVCEAVVK